MATAAEVPRTNIDGRERRVALITGITGQDGSYLAEFLIAKVGIPSFVPKRPLSLSLSKRPLSRNDLSLSRRRRRRRSLSRISRNDLPHGSHDTSRTNRYQLFSSLSRLSLSVLLDTIKRCKYKRMCIWTLMSLSLFAKYMYLIRDMQCTASSGVLRASTRRESSTSSTTYTRMVFVRIM